MHKFEIGVKAIIIHNEKILLIKRSDKYNNIKGTWDIPGGRINFGENPTDGLKREIMEETGLVLDNIIKILDASTVFLDDEKHIIRITYFCTIKENSITLSPEHTDIKWINPKNMDLKLKDKIIEKCIKKIDR